MLVLRPSHRRVWVKAQQSWLTEPLEFVLQDTGLPRIPLEVAGSVRTSSCRARTPRPEAKQRHDRSPAVGTK